MKPLQLEIIIASTRPGRIGSVVADWIAAYAKQNSDFAVNVADLAKINLPLLDEPVPPSYANKQYRHKHTQDWSSRIDAADAFIIVTPEYNYTMPPALVNALDYLWSEWAYKPVGFVGYGGFAAVRAIQVEKQLVTTLSMMPLYQDVRFRDTYSLDTFKPEEHQEQAATAMLTELKKWATALRPLHTSK
jgi:NAD(P)H-dependent FMN reductase